MLKALATAMSLMGKRRKKPLNNNVPDHGTAISKPLRNDWSKNYAKTPQNALIR